MHPQDTSATSLPPVLDFLPSCTDETRSCSDVSGKSVQCFGKPPEAPLTLSEGQHGLSVPPSYSRPSARLQELSDWFAGRVVGPGSEADSETEHESEVEEAADCPSSIYTGAQVVESSQSLVGVVVKEVTGPDAENEVIFDGVLERLDDLQNRRAWTAVVADEFERQGDVDVANRLRGCGCDAWFRRWVQTGDVDLLRVDWCNKRIVCANCEKARTSRTLASWVPKIRETLMLNPDLAPFMITLTINNGPHILERIQHISDSLGRLRQRKKDSKRGTGASGEFSKIEGAVWHLEVKRGKNSGDWHPHFHGICLRHRDTPFDLTKMHHEWNKATLGDSWNIDVRPTNFAREQLRTGRDAATIDESDPELLMGDLCEVLKYVTKPGVEPRDMIDVYRAVYGKRLVRTWGLLYGLTPEQADNDSITNYGEYVDFVFRFDRNNRPSLLALRQGVMSPDALSHAEERPRSLHLRWPCMKCGTFQGAECVYRESGPVYICKACQ